MKKPMSSKIDKRIGRKRIPRIHSYRGVTDRARALSELKVVKPRNPNRPRQ
jgi:hypothetical protein